MENVALTIINNYRQKTIGKKTRCISRKANTSPRIDFCSLYCSWSSQIALTKPVAESKKMEKKGCQSTITFEPLHAGIENN